MITPELFFWFASPIDWNNLWKKLNHEENRKEWFHWSIIKDPCKDRWFVYKEQVSYNEKGEKSWFTFLHSVESSRYIAELIVQFSKEYYIEKPIRMYIDVGLIR